MSLTILDGSTFCICDERGDLVSPTHGFFTADTRFLSRLCLTINGERPLLLSSKKVEYFSAGFYLRNPPAGGLEHDTIAIGRNRFVGDGMQDHLVVENESMEPVEFELAIDFGSDFADIFQVKDYDFALGDPMRAQPLPEPVVPSYEVDDDQFLLECPADGVHTQVHLSQRGEVAGGTVSYSISLEPRARWELRVDVVPSVDGAVVVPRAFERRFGEGRSRVRDSLAAWNLSVPRLTADWDDMHEAFRHSVGSLASLRMRASDDGANLPAAGMPWFMTVFGRDTIITCLQTLLFGPELARGALHALAALQSKEDDPTNDAEPGKIVHEVRRGNAAKNVYARSYSTVDATPLYLILLSEVWRWTDDAALVRSLRPNAEACLGWIDNYGDRDGDGFVEFQRRGGRGPDVQSWKDSHDSQRFADGSIARGPIASVEVQGYVYDAKRRVAELAREVWRDRELAERLDKEADALYERVNETFWIDVRGGYYALALDGEKALVDSLTSNIGHLLWSGIVPPERVDRVADRLMGEALWSGWGVRTMSTQDAGYNPLSYHNGTVWPHDNSLIASGLARHGRWSEAQRIARRMVEASRDFDYELPEVFAGLPRAETPFPIAYPTAARPQAWAAGTPVLLLQTLLGLRPDRRRQVLETEPELDLPSWAGTLRLAGVRVFDRLWDVTVERGRVEVAAA
jgi:glycogen debranching enzyme